MRDFTKNELLVLHKVLNKEELTIYEKSVATRLKKLITKKFNKM